MHALRSNRRWFGLILIAVTLSLWTEDAARGHVQPAPLQTQDATTDTHADTKAPVPLDPDRPLPDIPKLMLEVEAHEREAETLEKDYIFHSVQTVQEVDGHGAVKKTEVNEYDDFWIDGVPVQRLVKKDGKELSDEEKKKEDARVDQEAARARERRAREDAKGQESDPRGHDEITLSRILELGSFQNPRRVQLNGRDTIVVDYIGDPKARTQNRMETLIRDLLGTVWVDEQDHTITRTEGHFVNDFKIGGGLLADIRKGTTFSLQQVRINNEVWLPARAEGHGSARVLLFFSFHGTGTAVHSDYRKFKTSSTIVAAGAAGAAASERQTGSPGASGPDQPK
jgi:hypothetical protein